MNGEKLYQDVSGGCIWGRGADVLVNKRVEVLENRIESKIESYHSATNIHNKLAEDNRKKIEILSKLAREACADTGASRKLIEYQQRENIDFIVEVRKFKESIACETKLRFNELAEKFDSLWWKLLLATVLSNGATLIIAHFLGKGGGKL
jgi:hypothetical protein